jgi:hypothetical protein
VEILTNTALVVAMFALRFGVPLLIMFGVGYWLRRLDDKWQAEARARRATELARQELASGERHIELLKVIDPPCWVTKDCPPEARSRCPACRFSDVPCWLARYRMTHELPADCFSCPRFVPRRREIERKVIVER